MPDFSYQSNDLDRKFNLIRSLLNDAESNPETTAIQLTAPLDPFSEESVLGDDKIEGFLWNLWPW